MAEAERAREEAELVPVQAEVEEELAPAEVGEPEAVRVEVGRVAEERVRVEEAVLVQVQDLAEAVRARAAAELERDRAERERRENG